MLSSIWPDPEIEHGGHALTRARTRNPIRRFAFAFDDAFERTAERYRRWLGGALRQRWWVLGGAVVSIVAAFAIFPLLGFTWLPDYDGGEFNTSIKVPPGSRLEYTVAKAQTVAAFLREQPEVEFTYVNVGGGFRGSPNTGTIYTRLKPRKDRVRTQVEIQTSLRAKMMSVPGVFAAITGTPSIFGGMRQPIQIYVQGPEATRLKVAADQVLAAIKTIPGIAEPQSSETGNIPQLRLEGLKGEFLRNGNLMPGNILSLSYPAMNDADYRIVVIGLQGQGAIHKLTITESDNVPPKVEKLMVNAGPFSENVL